MTILIRCVGILFLVAMAYSGEVGELGRAERLVITGCQAHSIDELRQALGQDSEYLIASHPRAPLDKLFTTIAQRLTIGLQASGFPRAQVTAEQEQDHIAVRVIEGERFTAGPVVVDGNRAISTARLVEGLTSPQARNQPWFANPGPIGKDVKDPEDPVWKMGAPARCDDAFLANLKEQLGHCYAYAGHMKAVFTTRFEFRPNHTADLIISIQDEGQPATLGEVVFKGLERNERAALERALDIRKDMPVDEGTVTRIEAKLRASGRFRTQKATLEAMDGAARFRLVVTVLESRTLPPLSDELSEIDQTLMRTHAWATECLRGGRQDLQVSWSLRDARRVMDMRIVVSPQTGYGIFLDARPVTGKPWRSAAIFTGTGSTLASTAVGRGLRCRPIPTLTLTSNLTGADDDRNDQSKQEDRGSFSFNIGWSTRRRASPVITEFTLEANPILNLAHRGNAKAVLADGRLTITQDAYTCRIDARSGRLEDLVFAGEGPDRSGEIRVSFADDMLNRELAAIDAWGKELTWNSDPTVADLGNAVLDETSAVFAASQGSDDRSQQPIGGLLALIKGFTPSLNNLVSTSPKGHDDVFFIPAAVDYRQNPTAFFASIPAWLASALARDLSVDSWPVLLLRGTSNVLMGDTRYVGADLQRLSMSEEFGPLGCLTVGRTLTLISQAQLAKSFGQLGLERFDERHVAADLHLLQPYAVELSRNLAALPADTAALDMLPARDRDAGREILARLRDGIKANGDPKALLGTLCTDIWKLALGDQVRKALQALVQPERAKDGGDIP